MKKCHVCGFECEDSAELCPVCGAEIKIEQQEEQPNDIIINNPCLLATVDDVVSSEILKDILKDNNIPFSCPEEESEGTLKVTFGGSFIADDFYVDEKDFEKANEIYQQFLNQEPSFDESFFEEDLNEENEEE